MVIQRKKMFDKNSLHQPSDCNPISTSFKNEHDYKSAINGDFRLTKDHVKQLSAYVNESTRTTKIALTIVNANQGYKTLGYADFKAYVEGELSISYDAALKQLWAAQTAYKIGGLEAIGRFSDNSMLPMKDLNKNQIKKVVDLLANKHGKEVISEYKCTRSMAEKAMSSLGLSVTKDTETDDVLNIDKEPTAKEGKKSKVDEKSTPKKPANNSQAQFLTKFKSKTTQTSSIKAVFDAFIETDAGQNPDIVMKAIRLLTSHYGSLVLSNVQVNPTTHDE